MDVWWTKYDNIIFIAKVKQCKFQKYHNEREFTDSTSFGFSLEGFFGFDSSDSQTEKTKSDAEKKHDVKKEKSKLSLGVTSTYGDNAKSDDERKYDLEMISKNTISYDDFQKHLKKDNINVKWTGTKFTPKDLLLYRLNTKTLKASGEVLFKRIITTKFESTQKIEIRHEPLIQSVSPIYYEELKNQVTSLKERFEKIENNLTNYLHPDLNFDFRKIANPFEYTIPPGSLNDKKEIILTATPKAGGKLFHFRLKRGGDYFFSNRIEFPKNGGEVKYVWNSYLQNTWRLQENIVNRYPFREGQTFVYKIKFGIESFDVYVGGQRQFTFNYPPDIHLKEINIISVSDDIIIERIELKNSL